MTGREGADSSHTLSMESGTPSTYFCPRASAMRSLAAISVLSSLNACRDAAVCQTHSCLQG